ncbi:MAG: hypothetical protein AAF066_17645 [Pseudomonadota bacterium]
MVAIRHWRYWQRFENGAVLVFVPKGYLSINDTVSRLRIWLRKHRQVTLEDEIHEAAEARHQLRQALAAGDLVVMTLEREDDRETRIPKNYWIDDERAETALETEMVESQIRRKDTKFVAAYIPINGVSRVIENGYSHYRLLKWPPEEVREDTAQSVEGPGGGGRPSKQKLAAKCYWQLFPSGHGNETWQGAANKVGDKLEESVSIDTLKRTLGAKD